MAIPLLMPFPSLFTILLQHDFPPLSCFVCLSRGNNMDFNFPALLLIFSFSSIQLTSPLTSCHRILASSRISASAPVLHIPDVRSSPVSYISEPPSSPVSYISESPSSPISYISEPPSSPVSFIPGAPASLPNPSWTSTSSLAPSPSSSITSSDDKKQEPDTFDASTIKKLCEATENPTLCANSILPFLKGPFEPMEALKTEIKSFLSLSDKAIAQLKAIKNHPSTSKSTAKCVQVCLEIYSSARDDLKHANGAIGSNDSGLLKSMLSGAITDLGTCDDAFAESGEELPLDNDLVETMHKLADNCMDISSVLFV